MALERLCHLHGSEEQGQGLEEAAHSGKTSAQSCPTPPSHGSSCLLAPLSGRGTLGNSTVVLGRLSDVYTSLERKPEARL